MTADDNPFELGEAWFTLGVVTPTRLAAMDAKWALGEDLHAEHYRWGAFVEFLAENRPLRPELAAGLYELGERDSDQSMGGAMMDTIARLPECPESVLTAAARSGRRHLERVVERRRASQDTERNLDSAVQRALEQPSGLDGGGSAAAPTLIAQLGRYTAISWYGSSSKGLHSGGIKLEICGR